MLNCDTQPLALLAFTVKIQPNCTLHSASTSQTHRLPHQPMCQSLVLVLRPMILMQGTFMTPLPH